MPDITVSIICIAFNHAPYIGKAIDSFLAQKCKFKFEIVIGEDCSKDDTRKICLQYSHKHPGLIRLLSSERNLGMIANLERTCLEARGEYISICEGDDYWIDSHKLQKQVEFLRENPDYKLVHTAKKLLLDGDEINDRVLAIKTGYIFEDLIISNTITTLTVMVDSWILKSAISSVSSYAVKSKWTMLDYAVWLEIALDHKIGYLYDVTGVYRVLPESASRSSFRLKSYRIEKCVVDVKEFFYREYLKRKQDIQNNFKKDFKIKIYHLKKRLFLDYGVLAYRELLAVITTSPAIQIHVFFKKIMKFLNPA
jgi:glycosyltransferase involved in cell wall biosynthesis